jgi:hypothetical protein
MDAQLKENWVEALRSGRYEQAYSYLRHGGGFCCLGVLCDIVDPAKWSGDGDLKQYVDGNDVCMGFLPFSIKDSAGITQEEETRLSVMNDEGKPLSEIADYIEKHL